MSTSHKYKEKYQGVLLTRPMNETLRLAQNLRLCGYHLYFQPLLTIHTTRVLTQCFENLEGYDFIFTSRHGVHVFAKHSAFRQTSVWCVGDQTAKAARDAGFTQVHRSDGGDGASLKACILLSDAHRHFIHFSGSDVTMDFEKELPHCRRVILYETQPSQQVRPSIMRALDNNSIQHILLFSKKSAKALKSLASICPSIRIHALSQTIASVFPDNPHSICVSEDAMVIKLKALQK